MSEANSSTAIYKNVDWGSWSPVYLVLSANENEAAGIESTLKALEFITTESVDLELGEFTFDVPFNVSLWVAPHGRYRILHIPGCRYDEDRGFMTLILDAVAKSRYSDSIEAVFFVGCAAITDDQSDAALTTGMFLVNKATWLTAGRMTPNGMKNKVAPGQWRPIDRKLGGLFDRRSNFAIAEAFCVENTQAAGVSEELAVLIAANRRGKLVEMEASYFFKAVKNHKWPALMFRVPTDRCGAADAASFSATQEPRVASLCRAVLTVLESHHAEPVTHTWVSPPSTGLSVKDIRDAARRFASDYSGLSRENADSNSFWDALFKVYGVDRLLTVKFQDPTPRPSTHGDGLADVFWPGVFLAEHKSKHVSLAEAMRQAEDYVLGMEPTRRPRVLCACNFEEMQLRDMSTGEEASFRVEDFGHHYQKLLFLAGFESRTFAAEHSADQEAVDRLSRVHLALVGDLPPAKRAEKASAIQRFLIRCVYLMFAEDVGLLQSPTAFTDFIMSTNGDSLGAQLDELFEDVLAEAEADRRQTIRAKPINQFPYVNGGLFDGEHLGIKTTELVREELLRSARETDWETISPAIFGAMFQTVLADVGVDRRKGGMHYTTEHNIMRVVGPLLLDELETELSSIHGDKTRLRAFVEKLGSYRFLDPACGCGNFLVVTYRELRRLERKALDQIMPRELSFADDLEKFRRVSVDQFYGIEVEEFPVRVAQIALHIAEHLENRELAARAGVAMSEFPLKALPNIRHLDALVRDEGGGVLRRRDWSEVLPAGECSFVIGNPPFVGQYQKSNDQTTALKLAWGKDYNGYLDFVTGWFAQAASYMRENPEIRTGFVATNSISQGVPVSALWDPLFNAGFGIDFAHRTFAWSSEAAGKAHVHVVIIGFSLRHAESPPPRLFDYLDLLGEPIEVPDVRSISPYLIDGPPVTVVDRVRPLAGWVPEMVYGSKPTDRGGLIVEPVDEAGIRNDPLAVEYLRKLVGAQTMLNGASRWCLWMLDADPRDLQASPTLRDRISLVREFRLKSTKQRTRQMAATSYLFDEIRQPAAGSYLAVPRHSSETRRVVPIVEFGADDIAHDSLLIVPNAPLEVFGLLQSAMWMAWLSVVGGRLKSDFRVSASGVYNTFPFPELTDKQKAAITKEMQGVLNARATKPGVPLNVLYSPMTMPVDLVRAHDRLDREVDKAFGFTDGREATETQRFGRLIDRYLALTAGRASASSD